MPNRLRNPKVDYVSMVARPANQAATFVLAKHDPIPTEEHIVPKLELAAKATAATAANADAEDGATDESAEANAVGKTVAGTLMVAQETISKAEFTKLQEQNAKILKQLEDADARAQKAEAVAKAEQDARELSTAIAKAEKDLPALPGATSTEVGTLLRDISKSVTAEQYARLETILLAANAAVAKGDLFKEAGASGAAHADGNSAMDQLQAVAKSLIEKDPELTPSRSIAKAMTLRPDLVKLDRKERGFARD